ncbi:probable 1-acylglycerol-3-phosphate O-acyltransferase [Lactuca sativa]|uniref:probable 1-acylglycerol-3-phosphate O-acyltransferase n=1 Tax=Lactuca sativa TaxID=4236 RepID=UPI001C68F664|nr:probable 1-acylglycerol-3-phosphate O-acyltransferase [Lactuca sativa]
MRPQKEKWDKAKQAIQVKMNILQFSGFVWQESDEKQKVKVKEKLDKHNKEKLLEFCDLFDMPIVKTSAKKPHVTNNELLSEKEQDWFIDSHEEYRKAKKRDKFILLGHSFGGYVVSKYALKHPEHIQHLVFMGPTGFTSEVYHKSECLTKFRATWKGAVMSHLWESNFTPMKVIREIEL